MKKGALIISLFLIGIAVLSIQRTVITTTGYGTSLSSVFHNLIAVQADPPEDCDTYTGQCVVKGEVFCQDSGPKYPVVNATMLLDVPAVPQFDDMYRTTDANGEFNFNESGQEPSIISGIVVSVSSLPVDAKLPTGLLYTKMQGPTSTIIDTDPSNKYLEFRYRGCTSDCDDVHLMASREGRNLITVTAIYRVREPQIYETNTVGMIYTVEQNGQVVATSPEISASNIGRVHDAKGKPIDRYSSSWSYVVPATGTGIASYRITVNSIPSFVQASGRTDNEVAGVSNSMFLDSGDVLAAEPSPGGPGLKLGTFTPLKFGCKEVSFDVSY